MYAVDIGLKEDSRENLQHIVDEFERTCDKLCLKIIAGKSAVLVVKKGSERESCELIGIRRRIDGKKKKEQKERNRERAQPN